MIRHPDTYLHIYQAIAGFLTLSNHLSHDRAHLAGLQRKRRAKMRRIDYMPGADALAIIEATKAGLVPRTVAATNSAVIDAIVCEWARLAGIGRSDFELPMTSVPAAGISAPIRAGAYDFGDRPEFSDASRVRAGAYESGTDSPRWGETRLAANKAKQSSRRVPCGAKRHRDGKQCKALSEPGKRRCRFHGGKSTGPRTPDGKARALSNLRQYRSPNDSPTG